MTKKPAKAPFNGWILSDPFLYINWSESTLTGPIGLSVTSQSIRAFLSPGELRGVE